MAPKAGVTVEDDIKFLLAVIKVGGLGATINWQKVVDETGIVSKGAASKRYSRMPGKYNAATAASATEDQADGEDSAAAETPKRTKKPAGKKSSAKKRRITDVEEGEEDASPVQGEASN